MPVGNKFAESQGLSYVPNDAYLQEGFKGSTPLDFSNISSSGIMTQAPIIYPPINQGGGEGGRGPTGPKDYGYNSIVDNPNATPVGQPQTNFEYDIGEGTIDDEDIEEGSLSIVDGLRAMGAFAVGGPFNAGFSLNKSVNKNKQKEIDAINADINAQYGYGTGAASQGDMDSYGVDKDTGNPGNYDQDYDMKDGGRAGYFFGGRVNYKAGGRTDAGPNRSTASKAGVGQINESGQKVSGGNYNNDGGNNNPPPTFYDNGIQVITDQSKLGFNYPTGLTKNLGIGQLTAILDARKSLEEEEPEGMVQYDSSIGPVDTRATFDTTTGPEFNASYTNNNFNANLNSKTGLGVNYSKDIGPGTFTAGGNIDPDGTFNTEAKYGISFANGGLASIL